MVKKILVPVFFSLFILCLSFATGASPNFFAAKIALGLGVLILVIWLVLEIIGWRKYRKKQLVEEESFTSAEFRGGENDFGIEEDPHTEHAFV